MTALSVADFPAFFSAVRDGVATPFPWQQRLLTELASDEGEFARSGRWPALLDLPTSAGKTATIDIAVFLMALHEDAPRRIVFVVDRRVIVQQAATWAAVLARRLREAPRNGDNVVSSVAAALRSRMSPLGLAGRDPLIVAELRGAVERDERWAERPDQPAVIVSTVDQVGSRLLMQGYGVSPGMRPIHAGLLSNDVLFLLDEVHVSQPFADTLTAVRRLRGRSPWPGRDQWQVCQLSATPSAGPTHQDVFRLMEQDRASTLGVRTRARKPINLEEVRVGTDQSLHARVLGEAAARLAEGVMKTSGARTVGVVVNRVDTAVAAARSIGQAPAGVDVVLLTGRMRPHDRDEMLKGCVERIRSGRTRSEDDRPLVVVGTQSVEVGADFDFDALVTECASFDALKQRFGRVDRLGILNAAGPVVTSIVFASSRIDPDDPIYGSAAFETWAWLKAAARDFGIDHLGEPDPRDLGRMTTPRRQAPVLMPSHLDRWWQRDVSDGLPDVASWLHGFDERPLDGDVNVVWRTALLAPDGRLDDRYARNALTALPPRAAEAMSVPVSRVRRWLAGDRRPTRVEDVERSVGLDASEPAQDAIEARVSYLVWRPDEADLPESRDPTSEPRSLHVGDTVVVDAGVGGVTLGTWDPSSTKAVSDLAAASEDDLAVRLDRAVLEPQLRALNVELSPDMWGRMPAPDVEDPVVNGGLVDDIVEWLDELPTFDERVRGDLRAAPPTGGRRLRLRDVALIEGSHRPSSFFVLWPTSRASRFVSRAGATWSAPRRVELLDHLTTTQTWAKSFATTCGVAQDFVGVVADAAFWHDLGKLDPRFQAQLREGAIDQEGQLLAKSAVPAHDRRRLERARVAAGYPRGASHAALGAHLLRSNRSAATLESSAALVRHLVASHHGGGRPFVGVAEASTDGPPLFAANVAELEWVLDREVSLGHVGNGIPEDYWSAVRHLGWFGDAWLTCLVRLADHRASEFPDGEGNRDG